MSAQAEISMEKGARGVAREPIPIAIVSGTQTPYRMHVHRRIAREMPEIRLHSVFTHEINKAPWPWEDDEEIGTICFGRGEAEYESLKPRNLLKPRNIPRDWKRGGRIIQWLEEQGVQAIVIAGYSSAARMRIARHFRRRDIPVFLFGDSNIHGDNATGFKRLAKRIFVRSILKRFSAALSCGSFGEAYFIRYGVPQERIFRWPYEPDYAQIQNITVSESEAALRRFTQDPSRRRIVYSGRLAREKRVDLLIRAFGSIADERPAWDLLLIGGGPLQDDIEALIGSELAQRVKITGFLTDQRLVSALYRGSDLLVLPSDYEPWGLVINEAAAAGLAIVATSVVGAAAELVQDGVNGKLFSPGDEAALRDALMEVTRNERIDEMKIASRYVLDDWRREADPIDGLRSALQWAGVLGDASA